MTKFDHIYKNIILDVINNGKMQKGNVRARYADGTPAYTKRWSELLVASRVLIRLSVFTGCSEAHVA